MHSLNKGTSPVVTIRVPQDMLDKLDRERAVNHLSRSSFVRWALTAHLLDLAEARKEGKR